MQSETVISRELMGKIVDEVFAGYTEDESVIEEIYAVIKREEAALSAAEPVSSRNDEAGYVEFLNEDVPYIVRDIQGAVAILMDLETRNVIGYRVYDPDSVFAPPAPSVAVKALPDMAHILKVCVDMLKSIGFGAANIVEVAERALSAQVQDVAEGKELSRFELWFFQHLSDDQRTALFALNGYPTTGMDTHGKQKIALKHWFSRLPAAPAKQEGGHD